MKFLFKSKVRRHYNTSKTPNSFGFIYNPTSHGNQFSKYKSTDKRWEIVQFDRDGINLTEEEKDLLSEIDAYLSLSKNIVSAKELKRQGNRLLLRIHPDQCRMPNLNAHELTHKVIEHMYE